VPPETPTPKPAPIAAIPPAGTHTPAACFQERWKSGDLLSLQVAETQEYYLASRSQTLFVLGHRVLYGHAGLTPGRRTPQTNSMPHIYMRFDFGKDEEKAQLARHKLEIWKQAFRLDKKLAYVLARATDGDVAPEPAPSKAAKPKGKTKSKDAPEAPASNEPVEILLRLAFSNHEKLTEQRWVDRIPTEEPFVAASPKVLKPGDAHFEATEKEFEELQEPKRW
jgi:hypothetical protein